MSNTNPYPVDVFKIAYPGGEVATVEQPYQERDLYEMTTLETGMTKVVLFGAGAPVGNDRNWTDALKNPLPSGDGAVLGLKSYLCGPGGIVFDPQSAAGDGADVADALQQTLNQGIIRVIKEEQTIREAHLTSLIATPPQVYQGATPFAPAVVPTYQGPPQHLGERYPGLIFERPVMRVTQNVGLRIELHFGFPVPSDLNLHQLASILTVRNYPTFMGDRNYERFVD